MTPDNQNENPYIAELKSLLKDKFFMLLLGISVAIVLISTFYSILKPKTETGEVASGVQTVETAPSPTLAYDESAGIAGLETVGGTEVTAEKKENPSVLESLKEKASAIFGSKPPQETPKREDATEGVVTAAREGSDLKVGQTYTVVEGDNLWTLAEKVYSSGYNFVDIASANSIINPDYIEVGQKIKMPDVSPKESTVGDITPQAAMTKSEASIAPTYTVVEGDSLWNIAQNQYNDPYKWTRIAQLNPTITNPDFIIPGQVLKLK